MDSIHGHEVMRRMAAGGNTYTRDTLRAAIYEWFGETARFHTCSAENMDADALMDFLQARGKFVPMADGFGLPVEKICNH
ncbi:MAG: DUF2492 family protein [Calditrichaeota bacterium]|nr:MAG: DUF2492 family protein [Calditrichota bacterium]